MTIKRIKIVVGDLAWPLPYPELTRMKRIKIIGGDLAGHCRTLNSLA